MSQALTIVSFALAAFLWAIDPQSATAQGTAADDLHEAIDTYASATAATGKERVRLFREVQNELDRIVEAYPQSDLAMDILFQRPIDGIDPSVVNTEIRRSLTARAAALETADRFESVEAKPMQSGTEQSSEPGRDATGGAQIGTTMDKENENAAVDDPDGSAAVSLNFLGFSEFETLNNDSSVEPAVAVPEVPIVSQGENLPPEFAKSSEETEKRLELDRQAVRDVQARLLVIGHDPNGVDGVIGKGTRTAIRSWQVSAGLAATGFLSEPQLAFLKEQSQEMLDGWLKNRNNENLYSPPKRPKPTSSKPTKSNNSGWYRDSRGLYCKRSNFWTRCTSFKPKALR
jgi:hypothetical protein